MTKQQNREFKKLIKQFIEECKEHCEPLEKVKTILFLPPIDRNLFRRVERQLLTKSYKKAFKAWLTLLQ